MSLSRIFVWVKSWWGLNMFLSRWWQMEMFACESSLAFHSFMKSVGARTLSCFMPTSICFCGWCLLGSIRTNSHISLPRALVSLSDVFKIFNVACWKKFKLISSLCVVDDKVFGYFHPNLAPHLLSGKVIDESVYIIRFLKMSWLRISINSATSPEASLSAIPKIDAWV